MMTGQKNRNLLRTKRAAEHFQVTPQTLWLWSKQEGFPKPLKYARTVLYDITAIEKWMREHGGVSMKNDLTRQTSGQLALPKHAAEHFQVTPQTLRRWRKQEGFPKPLKYAQTVLYDIPAIEKWMSEQ